MWATPWARGTGDEATDWRLAAERIGAAVLVLEPRLLVFVEGVGGNCCPVATRQPAFWGGALDSAAAAPVRLPVPEKLVFSPHVYGPGAPSKLPPPAPHCCPSPHKATGEHVTGVPWGIAGLSRSGIVPLSVAD